MTYYAKWYIYIVFTCKEVVNMGHRMGVGDPCPTCGSRTTNEQANYDDNGTQYWETSSQECSECGQSWSVDIRRSVGLTNVHPQCNGCRQFDVHKDDARTRITYPNSTTTTVTEVWACDTCGKEHTKIVTTKLGPKLSAEELARKKQDDARRRRRARRRR